jgi:hypothetical protein
MGAILFLVTQQEKKRILAQQAKKLQIRILSGPVLIYNGQAARQ